LIKYWFLTDTLNDHTLLGVPLWAAIFGGLGACVQIFMGLGQDVRDDGFVSDSRQFWFIILPFVAVILGYLAYILVDLGVMTFGGTPLNTAMGNVSPVATAMGNASTGVATAMVNASTEVATQTMSASETSAKLGAKILVCFFAGYKTDDFISRLEGAVKK
jgi:hypothetical protein